MTNVFITFTDRRTQSLFLFHFLLVAILIVANRGAFAQARENRDYCSTSGKTVILLVDVTTQYDQTDKDIIVRMMDKILSTVHGGDKLLIRTIADSHSRSERLIERCIPNCAEAGTFGRLFNCSDGLIKTDFEEVRVNVIASLRQRLTKFEELARSDIVRTIFTVATEDKSQEHPLILYIYSDLIENSQYFSSNYLFSYTTDRLIAGLQYYKLIAPLDNAEVHVAGVGRDGTKERRPLSVRQLNKLTEFWKAYFDKSGAKLVVINPSVIQPTR